MITLLTEIKRVISESDNRFCSYSEIYDALRADGIRVSPASVCRRIQEEMKKGGRPTFEKEDNDEEKFAKFRLNLTLF